MKSVNNSGEVKRNGIQYDEGVELPKGFSSWEEVAKDGFSPISSKEVERLLNDLKEVK